MAEEKKKRGRNLGTYYRNRGRKFLEEHGWTVEPLERHVVFFNAKTAQRGFIKKDVFGADLLAMNSKEIIFVNVVLGRSHFAEHIERFRSFPFPPTVGLWIMVWEKGASEPEIIIVDR